MKNMSTYSEAAADEADLTCEICDVTSEEVVYVHEGPNGMAVGVNFCPDCLHG